MILLEPLANIFKCINIQAALRLFRMEWRPSRTSPFGESFMQLEAKRAQVAAYFLKRRGGSLTIMELVKLMYLADRESLDRYGFPITWDQPYAMQHGPVPTETYNCIKNENGQCGVEWPKLVSPPGGVQHRDLNLVVDIDIDDMDELSEADLEVLEATWAKFGRMTAYQLRKWTHENCPEWVDPGTTSTPIPYKEIFKALKKDPQLIPALAQHVEDQALINHILTRA